MKCENYMRILFLLRNLNSIHQFNEIFYFVESKSSLKKIEKS